MSVTLSLDSLQTNEPFVMEEVFPSDGDEKLRVIEDLLQRVETRETLKEEDKFRVRLCFDELIENALKHGNQYDKTKNVMVGYWEDDRGWGVVVKDEGTGFKLNAVRDPLSDEGLMAENGRGIFILSQFMDSVEYFDGGRTARIYKSWSKYR